MNFHEDANALHYGMKSYIEEMAREIEEAGQFDDRFIIFESHLFEKDIEKGVTKDFSNYARVADLVVPMKGSLMYEDYPDYDIIYPIMNCLPTIRRDLKKNVIIAHTTMDDSGKVEVMCGAVQSADD